MYRADLESPFWKVEIEREKVLREAHKRLIKMQKEMDTNSLKNQGWGLVASNKR